MLHIQHATWSLASQIAALCAELNDPRLGGGPCRVVVRGDRDGYTDLPVHGARQGSGYGLHASCEGVQVMLAARWCRMALGSTRSGRLRGGGQGP